MHNQVYVEAGAHDGMCGSRSLHLANADHLGILIEPTVALFDKCVHNRARMERAQHMAHVHNCALVSFAYAHPTVHMKISSVDAGMNTSDTHAAPHPDSTYSGYTTTVPARTLQSILDEHGITVVDHMFLDTEGAEKSVIDGIDHARTIIKNLEIELHHFRVMGVQGETHMHVENLHKFNMTLVDTWECSGGYKISFKYVA
jgi:FkbM family methyltransferase